MQNNWQFSTWTVVLTMMSRDLDYWVSISQLINWLIEEKLMTIYFDDLLISSVLIQAQVSNIYWLQLCKDTDRRNQWHWEMTFGSNICLKEKWKEFDYKLQFTQELLLNTIFRNFNWAFSFSATLYLFIGR